MLFTIDIGNTSINMGLFEGEELVHSWRLMSGIDRSADEYGSLIFSLLQRHGIPISSIRGAVLCSVVPPLIPVFTEVCTGYLDTKPLVVEPGIKTGLRLLVDNPRELGPDRVANVVAGTLLYGKPLIVIDFGTATTFDVVSSAGDFLGGAIAPGITIASEALFRRTAMLPRIELLQPKHAIGRGTVTAMQSGILFGYMGLIEKLVHEITRELEAVPVVVATGGYANMFAEIVPAIQISNPDLSLIGLRLLHEMNTIER